MSEELHTGDSRVSARAVAAAEAARLIAAGETIDKPTVDVPEGFTPTDIMRLPDQTTPERLEEARRKLNGPKRSSGGRPNVLGAPVVHEGKRRGRYFDEDQG